MNNALDQFDFMQRRKVEALTKALMDIVDCYDARSEIYTRDSDLAGVLADKARQALGGGTDTKTQTRTERLAMPADKLDLAQFADRIDDNDAYAQLLAYASKLEADNKRLREALESAISSDGDVGMIDAGRLAKLRFNAISEKSRAALEATK